ncbi:MAG TPA: ABC transporter ATP-binding protein [Acidobacteriota bacterium]|jgi:putative ABC transport system ATP-binding protein
METVVRLENIDKSYRLGKIDVPALKNVDLELKSGDFAALAGPSGSGKTTLLNLIGCIDKPTRGRIHLGDKDVTGMPLHRLAAVRRQRIGFIFQTFNLIPVLTAFENVEYPLLLSGMPKKERFERVDSLLERIGLAGQRKQKPDQLSGGQRQRVAIARALVTEPAVILADEPTANLDSETAVEILDLLWGINRETGTTLLFSTHDPRIIERARRRIRLRDGQILSDEYSVEAMDDLRPHIMPQPVETRHVASEL